MNRIHPKRVKKLSQSFFATSTFPIHSFLMLYFYSLFLETIVENKETYLRLHVAKGGKLCAGLEETFTYLKLPPCRSVEKTEKNTFYLVFSTPLWFSQDFKCISSRGKKGVLCEEHFAGEK